jgi:hypothetical protein
MAVLELQGSEDKKTVQTTGPMMYAHIPENFNLQHHHHENLKSLSVSQTSVSKQFQ